MPYSDILHHTRTLLKIFGVAALYAGLAHASHLYVMTGGAGISAVWPSSGLALAAILIGGKRYAWSVIIGSLLMTNVMATGMVWADVVIATGNTLAALMGALLLGRNGTLEPGIDSLRDFLRLILLGGCAASIVSALLGNIALLISGLGISGEFLYSLMRWWMADVLGILLVTPLILSWHKTESAHKATTVWKLEFILLLGLVFLIGQIVFLDWFHDSLGAVAKVYWTFLLIVWVAARLGARGVTIALCMTLIQALLGAYYENGIFEHDIEETQLVNFWFYMVALSVVGMVLAVRITQRKQAVEALNQFKFTLDQMLDGIFMFREEDFRFIYVNQGAMKQVGYSYDELLGMASTDIKPNITLERFQEMVQPLRDGAKPALTFETVHRHKDGHDTPVEIFLQLVKMEGAEPRFMSIVRDIAKRKETEQELELYRMMIEKSGDPFFVIDNTDNGRMIYVNDAAVKHYGAPREEIYALHISDWNPSFSYEMLHRHVENMKNTAGMHIESIHRVKGGALVPVEISINPINYKGRSCHYGYFRDISARKQAENTLRKLSLAVEQSPHSIIITDLEENIEYVNQAFVQETGYSFAEAVGKNPRVLNSENTPKKVYREIWTCLMRGEMWKGELTSRRKDGSEYIESVLISPVCRDDGRATNYLAIKENITERKYNESRIDRLGRAYCLLSLVNETIVRAKSKEELFAAICEATVESALFRFVWIGVLDEQKLEVTPVAYVGAEAGYMSKLNIRLGDECTCNGPIGRAMRDGVHIVCHDIANDPCMAPWCEETVKRGYMASGVFPFRNIGVVAGSINAYAEDANFFTPDIIRLMLELAADVSFALDTFTEKERREWAENEIRQLNSELEHRVMDRTRQLEALNKELEAFSYSVSHDLRAPLRGIDGFSRNLSRKYHDKLDDTGRDWLERICRASQRMGCLIDDMLKLSQVTRSPMKREQVNLSGIAENVVEELRKAHPERQARFVVQQGLSAQADPGMLHIVMNNLLGNAWKFTGKRNAAEIEFGMSEVDGEQIFFVRDNGDGFNMEYAHKLFGAFQRLHGESEFDGTGIGLATVQRVIRRHNGKIWAEAIKDQGATFYFKLPQRSRRS